MEKISVIIPVYNAQTYLEQTLTCLENQSFRDFEVVLVDDGSTDNSGAICDRYAAKDARFKVIHKENGGASTARNCGVANAQGEYIAFIDSDDLVDADFLEQLIRQMEENDTDLVICGYDRFYHDDPTDKVDYLLGAEEIGVLKTNMDIANLFTVPKTSLSAVAVWAKLYRTSIIRQHNVHFPEDIHYEEDCCFNTQYYRYARSAVTIQKNLYHYRQLTQSLSKVYKTATFDYLINGYKERIALFQELGMTPGARKKLDNIFLMVMINNLKKIVKTKMGYFKKRKAYKSVLAHPESQYVLANCGLPKLQSTRQITLACKGNHITRLSILLWLWKIKNGE